MKILSKALCVSVALLILSACQKTTYQPPTPPTPQPTYEPPAQVTEEQQEDPNQEAETNPENTVLELATPPEYTLNEVQNHLTSFEFNQETEYLNCAHSAIGGCQTQTVFSKAQGSKDPSICELLGQDQEAGCKNQIWQALSVLEDDVNLCEKISEENSQIECHNSFYFSKAIANQDESICENIKSPSVLNPVTVVAAPTDENENIEPTNIPTETIEADPTPLINDCKQQVEIAIEFPLPEAPVTEAPTEPIADLSAIPAEDIAPENFDPEAEPVEATEIIVDPIDPTQTTADDLTPPDFDPNANPVQSAEVITNPVDPTQAPADDLTPTDGP